MSDSTPAETAPYTLTDEDGGNLRVRRCPGHGHAILCVTELQPDGREARPSASVCVDSASVLDVTRAMHEAAGMELPVMIGRPDLPADGTSVDVAGFRLWAGGGNVQYQADANGEMAPHAARQLAAAIVALADSVPESEPDPADIDELAHEIRVALYPDSDREGLRPSASDMVAARTAMRWMNGRGMRDA